MTQLHHDDGKCGVRCDNDMIQVFWGLCVARPYIGLKIGRGVALISEKERKLNKL